MRNLLLTLISLVTFSCEYEYNEPMYQTGDIVTIPPDTAMVEIIDYTSWSDRIRYTVEYIDSVPMTRTLVYQKDIINKVEQ